MGSYWGRRDPRSFLSGWKIWWAKKENRGINGRRVPARGNKRQSPRRHRVGQKSPPPKNKLAQSPSCRHLHVCCGAPRRRRQQHQSRHDFRHTHPAVTRQPDSIQKVGSASRRCPAKAAPRGCPRVDHRAHPSTDHVGACRRVPPVLRASMASARLRRTVCPLGIRPRLAKFSGRRHPALIRNSTGNAESPPLDPIWQSSNTNAAQTWADRPAPTYRGRSVHDRFGGPSPDSGDTTECGVWWPVSWYLLSSSTSDLGIVP